MKPTLQRLDYERDRTSFRNRQNRYKIIRHRGNRTGNQQFVRYAFPVFLEPEWPSIQAVRIPGVSWMGGNGDRVEKTLRQVLEEVVSLEFKKLTEEPCEFFSLPGA